MEAFVIIAVLVAAAAFAAYKALYRRLHANECRGYIVLPCTAKTKDLERLVRAYYWEEVFEREEYARQILIVICEHSENDYTAKRLEQELKNVRALDISQLAFYLKERMLADNLESG